MFLLFFFYPGFISNKKSFPVVPFEAKTRKKEMAKKVANWKEMATTAAAGPSLCFFFFSFSAFILLDEKKCDAASGACRVFFRAAETDEK